MSNPFSWFSLAIGGYLLYCGVTGKGQVYKNEYIKKGMEELYFKRIRILALIVGTLMVAQSAVEYFMGETLDPTLNIVSWVLYGLSAVAIAMIMVVSIRMTDRKRAAVSKTVTRATPRSAFEFDDESKSRTGGNGESDFEGK